MESLIFLNLEEGWKARVPGGRFIAAALRPPAPGHQTCFTLTGWRFIQLTTEYMMWLCHQRVKPKENAGSTILQGTVTQSSF